MPDREKVIKAVEEAFDLVHSDFIGTDDFNEAEWEQNKTDAIALLKKQEPAMPTWSQGKAYCGKCGQRLPRKRADREINYCGYCGQKVKWE